MRIRQAIIAIGGKATRIRKAGISVPVSKSFLKVGGLPILHWTLVSLSKAGVTRIVLCADDSLQLREAELVLQGGLGSLFEDIKYFCDAGLGVHGLPNQIIRAEPNWLDNSFISECGHSIMMPTQYINLSLRKSADNIVFSAFVPHPSNARQPVLLDGPSVRLLGRSQPGCHALAHPIIADREYAERLPRLGFDIKQILAHYSAHCRLSYVMSDMPPEFDVAEEMDKVMPLYENYIVSSLAQSLEPAQVNG